MDVTEGRVADLEMRVLRLEGKLEEIRENIIGLENLGTGAYHSTLEGILNQIETLTAMVARLVAMVEKDAKSKTVRDPDLEEGLDREAR